MGDLDTHPPQFSGLLQDPFIPETGCEDGLGVHAKGLLTGFRLQQGHTFVIDLNPNVDAFIGLFLLELETGCERITVVMELAS